MSSIISESTINKLKAVRKVFLWAGVCILIGELVLGAILILVGSSSETIVRIQLTFLVLAISLFIAINNFIRMEKGEPLTQGFALVSFLTNLISLILTILLIWGVINVINTGAYSYYSSSSSLSATGQVLLIALDLMAGCFWISNVLAIKETVKPVKPLKITALICMAYCTIYSVVVTASNMLFTGDLKLSSLYALASLAFVLTALVALIVSKTNKKKEEKATVDMKNDKEVQSAIRDMVEKEVQERLAAEKKKAELDAMPPLQDENMEPTVSHDGNVVSHDEVENTFSGNKDDSGN